DIVACPNNALYDVVNESEVARVIAVVEKLYGFACEDLLSKEKKRHIRPPPRTVDGEEPQAGCRQEKQMAVAVSLQLVGSFRRRIELQGVIGTRVLAEWHSRVGAVDATGASIGEMRRRGMPAGLQDVCERDQVAVDVGLRVCQAVSDAGLCRQM